MKKAVCFQPPSSPSLPVLANPIPAVKLPDMSVLSGFFVDAGKGVKSHLQSDKGGKENTACMLLEPDE